MKQRSFRGVWLTSFWISLGVVVLAADRSGLTEPKSDPESLRFRLKAFVYAYAAISSDHLKVAKEVAAGIYANVGVQVEWVECYLAEENLRSNPECSRLTPTTLVVRILPRSQAERFKQPHFVFGFAQTVHSGGFGYYASVFYHRV